MYRDCRAKFILDIYQKSLSNRTRFRIRILYQKNLPTTGRYYHCRPGTLTGIIDNSNCYTSDTQGTTRVKTHPILDQSPLVCRHKVTIEYSSVDVQARGGHRGSDFLAANVNTRPLLWRRSNLACVPANWMAIMNLKLPVL
ncbi:hypothetical protein PMIN03_003701 [Paraphaeosphaeria minitans]